MKWHKNGVYNCVVMSSTHSWIQNVRCVLYWLGYRQLTPVATLQFSNMCLSNERLYGSLPLPYSFVITQLQHATKAKTHLNSPSWGFCLGSLQNSALALPLFFRFLVIHSLLPHRFVVTLLEFTSLVNRQLTARHESPTHTLSEAELSTVLQFPIHTATRTATLLSDQARDGMKQYAASAIFRIALSKWYP